MAIQPKHERLLKNFGAWLTAERGMAENTRIAYVADATRFLEYLSFENIEVSDVELDQLHQFVAQIHDLGIVARTQARIISAIRTFFNFLKMEGKIANNPALLLELPHIGVKLPEVLSVEEIDAMIEASQNDDILQRRNRVILELLYSCGLRVSELVNLTIGNLYLDEEFILVKGKGNKERIVPISNTALTALKDWILLDRPEISPKPGEEDILFLNRRGSRLTRNMIFIIIKQLADKVGITKNISPHTFRHSFATHLLDGGAGLHAIQQMLGHSSISTTELYLHIDRSQLREQILKFHPRNNKTDSAI